MHTQYARCVLDFYIIIAWMFSDSVDERTPLSGFHVSLRCLFEGTCNCPAAAAACSSAGR